MDKRLLRSYIMSFPGSFVGFLNVLSGILIDLGEEWNDASKTAWGETFIAAGLQCAQMAENLAVIRDEHDKEEMTKP